MHSAIHFKGFGSLLRIQFEVYVSSYVQPDFFVKGTQNTTSVLTHN